DTVGFGATSEALDKVARLLWIDCNRRQICSDKRCDHRAFVASRGLKDHSRWTKSCEPIHKLFEPLDIVGKLSMLQAGKRANIELVLRNVDADMDLRRLGWGFDFRFGLFHLTSKIR